MHWRKVVLASEPSTVLPNIHPLSNSAFYPENALTIRPLQPNSKHWREGGGGLGASANTPLSQWALSKMDLLRNRHRTVHHSVRSTPFGRQLSYGVKQGSLCLCVQPSPGDRVYPKTCNYCIRLYPRL